MKNVLRKIVPLLLIVTLLAGCGSKPGSSKRAANTSEPAIAYGTAGSNGYGVNYEMDEAVEAPAMPEPSEGGSELPAPGRKIIRNADLSVQTREFDTFLTDLDARVSATGGYVESSYTTGSGYTGRRSLRTATFTVRIPADKLDMFLDGLCSLGNVLYKNIYTNDVTASYTDTEARLEALRTERDTLLGLLEKAEKMEDVILIYDRISEVTYEIESLERKIRTWDEQIAYSTVTISVTEVERETVVVPETGWEEISRRFSENLHDVLDGLRDFGIWFVASLPGIVLIAIILFVIFLIIRAIVRKCLKKHAQRKAEKDRRPQKDAPAAETKPEKPAGKKK